MVVLVTRPMPDNEVTAAALRSKGYEVLLAPMLRFEAVAFHADLEEQYGAVVVTSANALRSIELDDGKSWLLNLPLFAVGERTAQAARIAGFHNVIVADGDGAALRELIVSSARAKVLKKSATLLYLAGADLARDLAGELGERGFNVVTHTTYRMIPVATLPRDACEAFATSRVVAVLHYSRRSARAFVDATQAAGVEISALATPQCCLSDAIALIVRDAGATHVAVASTPAEDALFEALDRALRRISR